MPTPNTPSYQLPEPSEKLSYKFILDSIVERETREELTEQSVERLEVQTLDLIPQPGVPRTTDFTPISLPSEKNYFRIGEVSERIGVEAHVLRYWENEFSVLRPQKSGSGHRVYSRKDVETLHYIRHLLHVEKFSIKGARAKLQEQRRQKNHPVPDTQKIKRMEFLKGVASDLKNLIQTARSNPGL